MQIALTNLEVGMFLWVQLVLDMLLEQHSVEDLRNTLNELPTELPGVLLNPAVFLTIVTDLVTQVCLDT